jgi:methyl-accepting chemotaxis protein
LLTRDHALIEHLQQFATEVEGLSHDVTNSIALTNQGVSHQKKETEKLTHAMSEMLTTAESVSSSAQDASQAANDAESSAREGQTILHKTTQAINDLADQVEQSSAVIANLARDSDSIGAILDVIKGIAEQTNLLALNAAIEAARAGEQGRGFAVVADEVRSLASRTHQSTSEIESMIQRLQQAAQSAAQSMSGGHEIAQSSVQQVSQAVAALDAITSAVERIKIMNTQIASAAEEQSAVTQEVKNNVEVIDEVNELTIETLDGLNQIGQKLEHLGNNIRHIAMK